MAHVPYLTTAMKLAQQSVDSTCDSIQRSVTMHYADVNRPKSAALIDAHANDLDRSRSAYAAAVKSVNDTFRKGSSAYQWLTVLSAKLSLYENALCAIVPDRVTV